MAASKLLISCKIIIRRVRQDQCRGTAHWEARRGAEKLWRENNVNDFMGGFGGGGQAARLNAL